MDIIKQTVACLFYKFGRKRARILLHHIGNKRNRQIGIGIFALHDCGNLINKIGHIFTTFSERDYLLERLVKLPPQSSRISAIKNIIYAIAHCVNQTVFIGIGKIFPAGSQKLIALK